MRYFLSAVITIGSLVGCANSYPVAQNSAPAPTIFAFESYEGARTVSAEPSKEHKKVAKPSEPQKFIAVFPCKKGEACAPKPEEKKIVPVSAVVESVKKNVAKNQDVLGHQEKILARGVAALKEQKKVMEAEYDYFDHQEKTYRYSSLRPVVDNFRRAKMDIAEDLKVFDQKIQLFEKDLNYLKNNHGQRIGMDSSTSKLMDMLEDGSWGTFGAYLDKEDQVLWNFFQHVGQDFAQN